MKAKSYELLIEKSSTMFKWVLNMRVSIDEQRNLQSGGMKSFWSAT